MISDETASLKQFIIKQLTKQSLDLRAEMQAGFTQLDRKIDTLAARLDHKIDDLSANVADAFDNLSDMIDEKFDDRGGHLQGWRLRDGK